jgi:16S rRNA (cytosine1402-N4)-methyltransferase
MNCSLEIAKKIGKAGTLFCIDLDNQALKEAKTFLEKELSGDKIPKIFYINDNFRNLETILRGKKVDAIMADLGVSSQEIDDSGRGFTFQKDEPLLMTLSDKVSKNTLTAKKIVNNWGEENLADIIFYYGDEKYARRIAKNICEFRKKKEIKTTFDLVDIISQSIPEKYKHGKTHFATKTFQALRMATNDELGSINDLLEALPNILASKGRACIITFHSTEDRIVKHGMRAQQDTLRMISKKAIIPSEEEINNNPRARSAQLRIVERI